VHALVLLQSTRTFKTSPAAIILTLQGLAADAVLSCMWHHVTLKSKRLSTARIWTAAVHANHCSKSNRYCLVSKL